MHVAVLPSRFLQLCASLLLFSVCAVAQNCTSSWVPHSGTGGLPGVNDTVYATCPWDPDGAGPAHELLAAGGTFTQAGGVPASRVAFWDPVTDSWSPLGTGITQTVVDISAGVSGKLVAAGEFGVSAWNGSSWQTVGSNLAGSPTAVVVLANDDILVGGNLTVSGTAVSVARWDGSVWTDTGLPASATIDTAIAMPNGDAIVGGVISLGVMPDSVVRWDGTSWHSLGPGVNYRVRALALAPNGDVIVGGHFTYVGGVPVPHIARWNGSVFSILGPGLPGNVLSVAVLANGDVTAFANGRVHLFDGTSWSVFSDWYVGVQTVMSNGDLVVTGGFEEIAPFHTANGVARWDGTTWSTMGATGGGPNGPCSCIASLPNGSVVVGGDFDHIGLQPVRNVAIWNGTSWIAMGAGLDGAVADVAVMPNGDVVAVGAFTESGGMPVNRIARWNGTSWLPIGTNLGFGSWSEPRVIVGMDNGQVLVGGDFASIDGVAANNIAVWDGVTWREMGSGLTDPLLGGDVLCLELLPDGDVVAAGDFQHANGLLVRNVARWDGFAWHAMSGGLWGFPVLGKVTDLAVLPNGHVVASGVFDTPASYIAEWNGVWWQPMNPGFNDAVHVAALPNNDVLAFGDNTVSRWNGSSWNAQSGAQDVHDAALTAQGDVFVVGGFLTLGGVVSPNIVAFESSCPAAVTTVGQPCPGAVGSNTFAADNLPWVGSTFRATAEGLPVSIVSVVTGFSTVALPLQSILPVGQAGCDLLVAPTLLGVASTVTGTLQTEVAIPNDPALAGLSVYQQVVPIEVDASLNFVSMTSTNALQLVLGTL